MWAGHHAFVAISVWPDVFTLNEVGDVLVHSTHRTEDNVFSQDDADRDGTSSAQRSFPDGGVVVDDVPRIAVDSTVSKRQGGIEAFKAGPVYQSLRHRLDRPTTPDPSTGEPKRRWEKRMREFRTWFTARSAEGDQAALSQADARPGEGSGGDSGAQQPRRVSVLTEPMYVEVAASTFDHSVAPVMGELPVVPWRSERRRSRSPPGAIEVDDEETWQRREAHRTAGVVAVKRSRQYLIVTEDTENARPKTPNPRDRTLSKRGWERGVQVWRVKLEAAAIAVRLQRRATERLLVGAAMWGQGTAGARRGGFDKFGLTMAVCDFL